MAFRKFSPSQKKAILHRGSNSALLCVAGSGKTTSMTHRAARLIKNGVPPERILLLTFTKPAAQEMERRVGQLCGGDVPEARTFHSLAYHYVVKQLGLIDISNFKPMDGSQGWRVEMWMKTIIKALGLRTSPQELEEEIRKLQWMGFQPSEPEMCPYPMPDPTMWKAFKQFYALKLEAGLFEFDDMIIELISVLRSNENGEADAFGKKYDFVMVDEYQDTSPSQEALIEFLCACPNPVEPTSVGKGKAELMAVGDDDQAIFSFCGGRPEPLVYFQKKWGGEVIKMENNYRSASQILDVANAVIRLNPVRVDKKLIYSREGLEGAATWIKTYDEGETVVNHVKALVESGYKYRDIAVLYRTHAKAGLIESRLTTAGIPYETFNDREGFYGITEVKTLLSYLRAVTRKHDLQSLKYLWSRPSRFLKGDLVKAEMSGNVTVPEALNRIIAKCSEVGRGDIGGRVDGIKQLLQAIHKMPPTKAIDHLYGALDYAQFLKTLTMRTGRSVDDMLVAVDSLRDTAAEFSTTAGLLDHVDKVIENHRGSKSKNPDKVKLMTIHRSKGLEFPVVFLAGVVADVLPHASSEIEEERRLLYVGMTRAEEQLFILQDLTKPTSKFFEDIKTVLEEPNAPDTKLRRSNDNEPSYF